MQEGIQDGGLSGLDDLIESVKKHDEATERIRERDGVKIKSKVIVLKNNLPKKKPPTFKELIVPSVQSTNALTMDLKTKKVPKCPFWKLQIFSVELYNHYWPWNKKGGEVAYKIREKERKTRDAPRSKPEKKKKVSLKKLERTQRVRSEGLERVAYDPKSVEKFGGIVE